MWRDVTRLAPLIWLALFAFACAPAGGSRNETAGRPEPGAGDEIMRDDTPAQHGTLLQVGLEANPEVRVGHDEDLGLHVRITNVGDEPVSIDELAGQLRVDDDDPLRLELRGHGFDTLLPGQTAEWDEANLGVRLLPGDHRLRLEINESESAPVDVHVEP